MNLAFIRKFFSRSSRNREIFPDEIFLDSSNLPEFNVDQFEGRLEKPISRRVILAVDILCTLIVCGFSYRLWHLQVVQGATFAEKSENNRLRHTTLFPERGIVTDRTGTRLAWNELNPDTDQFLTRTYTTDPGFSHILGYLKYPKKDSAGFYYQEDYEPKDGLELAYNHVLSGEKGSQIVEVNALGKVQSESVIQKPVAGKELRLSIDAPMQKKLHQAISTLAQRVSFPGGAGGVIDLANGELLALTSYPEYSSNVMANSKDPAEVRAILTNPNNPFINRFVDGLYTPGSTVKPFIAMAALNENIIDPRKQILSTGSISVPNPYDPTKKSVFTDWRPQGWVDMRHAIAVSSNVYFYEIGGGFEDQKGLGIERIGKYMHMFGFGEKIKAARTMLDGKEGVIPSPEWKAKTFNGDAWRLGDTYFTAIGQYGVQVTPLQLLVGVASLATDGTVLRPALVMGENDAYKPGKVDLPKEHFSIIKEGMRLGVKEGIARALDLPGITVAAKSGTAELGTSKRLVNSWIMGFFPYEKPRYAFVIVMEKGSRENREGAVVAGRDFFEWLVANRKDLFDTI